MMKSCSRCGKIHDFNKVCYKNTKTKELSMADKFRKTYKWHKKSDEIRKRDNYLCKCCRANIYNTDHIYNFNKLEVHHIVPLNTDYSKRLDDDNLVTLCCYHHKLADDNLIPKNILIKLTNINVNYDEIHREVEENIIPPTSKN